MSDEPWAWTTTQVDGMYVLTFDGREVGTVSLLDEIPLRPQHVDAMVDALNAVREP